MQIAHAAPLLDSHSAAKCCSKTIIPMLHSNQLKIYQLTNHRKTKWWGKRNAITHYPHPFTKLISISPICDLFSSKEFFGAKVQKQKLEIGLILMKFLTRHHCNAIWCWWRRFLPHVDVYFRPRRALIWDYTLMVCSNLRASCADNFHHANFRTQPPPKHSLRDKNSFIFLPLHYKGVPLGGSFEALNYLCGAQFA